MLIGAAGLLCVGTAQASYDGVVNIDRLGGYYSGNGGEFTVTVVSGLGTLVGSPFQTFCLESGEYVNIPGYGYNVNLNSKAINGGVGPAGDPISIGTAWLYSQFRGGALSGYNYSPGTGRIASAGALQAAIHWLEGEGGARNTFIDTAETALYGAGNTGGIYDTYLQGDAAAGLYGVVALNLYDQSGGRHQDQLGLVPEPTTMIAGALLLLPFGVSTLRVLRRNRAA